MGVKGTVTGTGQLDEGWDYLCAVSLVESTLLAPGIGQAPRRMGEHRSERRRHCRASPALDEATKAEFRTWGPGNNDPRHHAFDGTNIIPLEQPVAADCHPAYLRVEGRRVRTFTADGPISYWNSYVGVSQMGGHGSFSDPRIGLFIKQTPDLVSPSCPTCLSTN